MMPLAILTFPDYVYLAYVLKAEVIPDAGTMFSSKYFPEALDADVGDMVQYGATRHRRADGTGGCGSSIRYTLSGSV